MAIFEKCLLRFVAYLQSRSHAPLLIHLCNSIYSGFQPFFSGVAYWDSLPLNIMDFSPTIISFAAQEHFNLMKFHLSTLAFVSCTF